MQYYNIRIDQIVHIDKLLAKTGATYNQIRHLINSNKIKGKTKVLFHKAIPPVKWKGFICLNEKYYVLLQTQEDLLVNLNTRSVPVSTTKQIL